MTGPENPAAAGGDRLKVGHADREQAVETLKDAFAEGRLTKDELDARTGRALEARTRAELDAVTADVPARQPARPARARRRPRPRVRRRRPLLKAAAGSGACLAAAFGLILFAANFLDPRGLGNPYHPWSRLCAAVAMALVLVAALIAVCGVASAVDQRQARRRLPPSPGPGGRALGDESRGTDRSPAPPAPRDGQAPGAELRARHSRQRRRRAPAWSGQAGHRDPRPAPGTV